MKKVPNKPIAGPGILRVLSRGRHLVFPGKFPMPALGFSFFLIVLLLGTVPWLRPTVGFSDLAGLRIDLSAVLVLDDGFVRGAKFGSELVHPYGPLSFLRTSYYFPGTYGFFLLGRMLLAITLAISLWRLLRVVEATHILILLTTAGVLIWMASFQADPLFVLPALLLNLMFFVTDRNGPSLATLLCAVTMAMLSLAKFQYFVIGVAPLLAIAAAEVFLRRRVPWVMIVALIAFLGFWFAAGQGLGNLWPWVRNSFAISMNFNSAASLGFLEPGRLVQAAIFLVSSGALVLAHWIVLQPRFQNRAESALSLVALALFLYVHYKHGIVRHDAHAAFAAPGFIVAAGLYLLLLPGKELPRILLASYTVGLLAIIGVNLIVIAQWKMPLPRPSRIAAQVEAGASHLWRGISDNQEAMEAAYEAKAQQVRALANLPPLPGTVDVFPNNPAVVLMSGLNYRPRPAFTSVDAISMSALRDNAAFFRGPMAPDHLLVEIASVDNRLPTTEDSLSWPEWLARYRLTGLTQNFAVLGRSLHPRTYRLIPLRETEIGWGEALELNYSASDMIWAEVDIQPSLLGRLITLLYKAPATQISLSDGMGREQTFRLVPASAKVGFLLSPKVSNLSDFLALYQSPARRTISSRTVHSVRFLLSPHLPQMYKASIKVNLSRLQFDPPLGDPLPRETERLLQLARLQEGGGPQFKPPTGMMAADPWSGRKVLFAHAPNSLSLPLPGHVRQLQVEFGMMPSSYDQPSGDGVSFVITGKRVNGEMEELFSRDLDPARAPKDRGPQKASIALPPNTYRELLFQTRPGPRNNSGYDHSYWSDYSLE